MFAATGLFDEPEIPDKLDAHHTCTKFERLSPYANQGGCKHLPVILQIDDYLENYSVTKEKLNDLINKGKFETEMDIDCDGQEEQGIDDNFLEIIK